MRYISLVLIFFFIIISCQSDSNSTNAVNIDLPKIEERGVLKAITIYSATSYFIYKGKPMGYEYELLKRLADYMGLKLQIVIAKDINKIFELLNNGKGDIAAAGLTITKERTKKVDFTEYHNTIRQVLVQRKPPNWRLMKKHEIDDMLIRNPIELIGKKVHVRRASSYYSRLKNLSEEIGGDIKIVEVPGNVATEKIIKQVANGEIEYTVADENIALINQAYYPILDVETPVSFPQRIAWAVRKTSPKLLVVVNQWINDMKEKVDYYVIYNKYFKNRREYRERLESDYFSISGGSISRFDAIIKQYADSLGWDWRLFASQIYQESRFNPKAKSWAGAVGLMQMLPETAREYGAKNIYDTHENLKASANYLKWLLNYWEDIEDETERVKFAMASYNCGFGHIEDAQKLAEKYDAESDVWTDQVNQYILKLSEKEFFNDDVVQFGYCRGEEPYKYVQEIFERYEHYKRLIN
jgi:membrane-bound lytic murein transglycosylase F